MTPAGVLREALARLDGGKRWVKGTPHLIPNETACAWTAVNLPTGPFDCRVLGRAQRFLTDAVPRCYAGWRSVIRFNDDPATTWDDIRALYERAIKLAEESQG